MKADNSEEEKAADLSNQDNKKGGDNKSKTAKKGKDSLEHAQLPLLVEFIFTFSLIFLLLSDLLIVAISFISGANLLDIAIRTVVTTLVLGVLLWLLSGKLSKGALEAAYSSMFTEEKNSSPIDIDSIENNRVEA
jgi:hypothetical protein